MIILILLRLRHKTNLVFVIMRLTNQDFIQKHHYQHRGHCDDHRQGKVSLVVTFRVTCVVVLSEERVETIDSFGYDVDHSYRQEERARKCHGNIHDGLVLETFERRDETTEYGDLQKESGHQHYLQYHRAVHLS
jgi:hypothetical protein